MISLEIEKLIIKYYVKDNLSANKTANILKINRKTVYRVLRKHSKTRSLSQAAMKHTCNDNFFNIINTEKKAYWLGVLFADGNISKNSSKTGSLFFSSKDKEWVESFIKDINSSNTVKLESHSKFIKSKIWKIQITSKQLYDDLNNLGCTPVKSKTMLFPKLPKKLIPHFIRGYFDGDGTVGIYNNLKNDNWKILKSGFCSGSKQFLESLITYLPIQNKVVNTRNNSIYTIQISLNDTIELYKYMYNNHTVCLKRKKIIFEKYLTTYTPRKRFNDYNRPSL